MIKLKTESTRTFILDQFIKSFIYHFLNAFFGPLILPFLLCRENKTYLKNIAFMPNRTNGFLNFAFGAQLFSTMLGTIILALYALDYTKNEPEDRFDTLPLYLTLFMIVQRFFIVSVRHGSVPPKLYGKMSKTQLSTEQTQRQLLLHRWMLSDPQVILDEIDLEMSIMMMDAKYFKIKTFEPAHPLQLAKLRDI